MMYVAIQCFGLILLVDMDVAVGVRTLAEGKHVPETVKSVLLWF